MNPQVAIRLATSRDACCPEENFATPMTKLMISNKLDQFSI